MYAQQPTALFLPPQTSLEMDSGESGCRVALQDLGYQSLEVSRTPELKSLRVNVLQTV